MTNPTEIAEIEVNGQRYADWTTIHVEIDYTTLDRICRFTAVEDVGASSTLASMQIKPGDECSVYLGGQLVMTGFVYNRQSSYSARQHGVMLTCRSRTADLPNSSVKMNEMQFRNYSFSAIARKVLQPYGINLKVKTPPSDFDKKFRDVSAFPGETVYSFLERLARLRGVFLQDDENGSMVATQMEPGGSGGAQLEEGRNIIASSCVIDDETLFSKLTGYGQTQGTDERWGDRARHPAAEAKGPSTRHRERVFVVEDQVDDSEDVKRRVTQERNALLGRTIDVGVTVQGWFKDSGGLWTIGEIVSIKSPMHLLDHDLGVKTVVFSQADELGSVTNLTLVRPEFLSSGSKWGGSGVGGLLPGGTASEPKALTQ